MSTAEREDGAWLPPTEHRWPDPEVGPWRLTLLWQVVDGRPECVGVTALSSTPPDATPGLPLTGTVLRDLRVPERISTGRAQMTEDGQESTADRARRLGMRRSTAERFEEVARVYREALSSGERPIKAVAARFGLAETSASNLVGKVRAAGFLPPASPGVPVA